LLLELRDGLYPELAGQPPSTEWIGPMGFTPDQLPAIGVLRPGVVVAAGFNGYGGSYTTAAGEAAAALAVTGTAPPWLDAGVFAPTRFAPRRKRRSATPNS
jgi:glycine/D-amino acid oxidase-like deaminating enzyme